MRTIVFLLTAFLLVTSSSCQKDPASSPKEPQTIHLPAKGEQVISHSNEFGIELFNHVAADEQGNLMLSPLSASVALTMLLNGCEETTYEQIKDLLSYQGLTIAEINATYEILSEELLDVDPEVNIGFANSV